MEETKEKKELELIGYPCDAGTGVSMSFSRISVIPSVSGHKEGAWQFLKTILTAKGMYTVDGTYPVRKDYYEINKKCMLAKKKYVDEDGVQIYALGKENGYKITEEDIKKVERLIDMVDCRTLVSGHPLREIVEDEMAAYRAKDGTLEQAAGMIESRAKLYLGETS